MAILAIASTSVFLLAAVPSVAAERIQGSQPLPVTFLHSFPASSQQSSSRSSLRPTGSFGAGVLAGVSFQPPTESTPTPEVRFDRRWLTDALSDTPAASSQTAAPALAFEYSEAYQVRARVHRFASFATLPLFVTEAFLGESLYNSPTSGKKTAHLVVAGALGGLFGLNTVTGLPNLIEARKDPNYRKLRLVHGLLMMAADAGFLATALTGPGGEHGRFTSDSNARSTHRAIAFTSISTATAGYLIMLFGHR
jgi:hypothetical protein